MTTEDKTIFTRRITQGNRSDIIVVLFDIYMAYEEDARKALEAKDHKALLVASRHLSEVAQHLKEALDFKYELSLQLYPLYDFVQRCLARLSYAADKEMLDDAGYVMRELREAFMEVAQADHSERAMSNAQGVTAGITYGRNDLTEMADIDRNRGFLA